MHCLLAQADTYIYNLYLKIRRTSELRMDLCIKRRSSYDIDSLIGAGKETKKKGGELFLFKQKLFPL